jgi:hypothetical protein
MQCDDRFIFNNEHALTKRIFNGASGSDNMAVYVGFRNALYFGHFMCLESFNRGQKQALTALYRKFGDDTAAAA